MTPSPFCETETLCDLGVGDSQSRGERIYMYNTTHLYLWMETQRRAGLSLRAVLSDEPKNRVQEFYTLL